VAVVDDHGSLREAIEGLLRSAGHCVRGYASAEAFLACRAGPRASCLIVDWKLDGMSGLELQRQLRVRGNRLPVIVISAHAECEGRVRAHALADGALAFLRKPFSDLDLLGLVDQTMT
jgi:FixJ family two-component response regulator